MGSTGMGERLMTERPCHFRTYSDGRIICEVHLGDPTVCDRVRRGESDIEVARALLREALDGGNEIDGYVLDDWKRRARIRAFLRLPGSLTEAMAEIEDMRFGLPRQDRLGDGR
jgi:hypothetical protein